MTNEFAVFILTYGRASNVKTYKTLRKLGYTGDIKLICSDDDKDLKEYQKRYGDEVIVFNKKENSDFDLIDNSDDWRIVVFARNVCWKIAKELGYKYFYQYDDDYTSFNYRVDGRGKYNTRQTLIKDLDFFFNLLLNYFKKIDAHTLCIAQAGDFIGGVSCQVFKKGLSRKAMNSFLCATDKPFQFIGRINEDTTTYVRLGSIGLLFFTICEISLTQELTQQNKGGLTSTYLDGGTYIKSFYSVIVNPASVKVSLMGAKNRRLHHKINWNNSVPKIIEEEHKK